MEFLRKISWKKKNVGEISDFYFSPRKNNFAQGVYRGETRKKSFFLGLICIYIVVNMSHIHCVLSNFVLLSIVTFFFNKVCQF